MDFFARRHGRPHQRDAGAIKPGRAFDLPTLLELFDGDRGAILRLLEAALRSIAEDAATIEAGVRSKNRPNIIEAAHRLRGTSGTIGARRLTSVVLRIEDAAREALPVRAVQVRRLHAAVAAVAAEISAYRDDAR